MTPEEWAAKLVSDNLRANGNFVRMGWTLDMLEEWIAVAIYAAVAEEREACASLADDPVYSDWGRNVGWALAAAIRARGKELSR